MKTSFCSIFASIGVALMLLTVNPRLAKAVSEESIGAAGVRAVAPSSNAETAPARSAEDSGDRTAEQLQSTFSRPAPHSTFPYTIRPGDSFGTIAGQFGISIPDLLRANRMNEDSELVAGHTIRIPNPSVVHEREMTAEIDRLTRDKDEAEQQARTSGMALQGLRSHVQELTRDNDQTQRDLRSLSWWRGTAFVLGACAILLLGAMLLALAEWWVLRNRFRAVAEMNEMLRRLDYKYKIAFAKAELRLQELYGRRRRGIHEGQERPKIAEETDIDLLNRELKAILERHLERLGPASARARRAHWRERLSGIGSAVEVRPIRR